MSERIPDDRIAELVDFTSPEEEDDKELHSILTELQKRRRSSGYDREQRLGFLLRLVKDSMPEVAKDLREIYSEMENDVYYARRYMEDWKRRYDELKSMDQISP